MMWLQGSRAILESLFIATYLMGHPNALTTEAHEEFVASSPAFHNNQTIPIQYTCQGKNHSLPLVWRDAPVGTKSFAIIMKDLDAPKQPLIHWAVYDIPVSWHRLRTHAHLKSPIAIASNSWGHSQYEGPCPGHGKHRYEISVFALDAMLPSNNINTYQDLHRAMQKHIITHASVKGVFQEVH